MTFISEDGKRLFKEALIDFRVHPEKHKQDSWICGTGCCLAGNVVLMSGESQPRWVKLTGTDMPRLGDWAADTVERDGVDYSVKQEAIRLLGVGVRDAGFLFSGTNTIDDLEVMYQILDSGQPLTVQCGNCQARTVSKELAAELRKDSSLQSHWCTDHQGKAVLTTTVHYEAA